MEERKEFTSNDPNTLPISEGKLIEQIQRAMPVLDDAVEIETIDDYQESVETPLQSPLKEVYEQTELSPSLKGEFQEPSIDQESFQTSYITTTSLRRIPRQSNVVQTQQTQRSEQYQNYYAQQASSTYLPAQRKKQQRTITQQGAQKSFVGSATTWAVIGSGAVVGGGIGATLLFPFFG